MEVIQHHVLVYIHLSHLSAATYPNVQSRGHHITCILWMLAFTRLQTPHNSSASSKLQSHRIRDPVTW